MKALLWSALLAWAAEQSLAESVSAPSVGDTKLIEANLANIMRDPNSMVLSDLLAIVDPASGSGLTWVCGIVRGKNALGGNADPLPFISMLGNEPLSEDRVVNLLRVAENEEQVKLIHDMCLQKADFVRQVDLAGGDVQASIRRHADLQFECMVTGTASQACNDREEIEQALAKVGFCLDGNSQWMVCSAAR